MPLISTSATRHASNVVVLTVSSADRAGRHFEADVVAALLEWHDLGIVPLIAEPLAVREPARLRPGEESRERLRRVVGLVRAIHADVGDTACRLLAQVDHELVRSSGAQPGDAGSAATSRAGPLLPSGESPRDRSGAARRHSARERIGRSRSSTRTRTPARSRSAWRRTGATEGRRRRSSRTRLMNAPSVSPISVRKMRWKWNGEKHAASATSSSRIRSPRLAVT